MLPCASCPAIRLDVTLLADGSYELQRTYLMTRDGDRTMTGDGRWTLDQRGGRAIYRLTAAAGGEEEALLEAGADELRVLGADDVELPPSLPHTLVRVDASSGAAPVTLGEADAGRTIHVVPGQDVILRLASNRTTGFRWTLVDAPKDLLLAPRESDYVPDASSGRVGSGGVETWRIVALRRGEARLRLSYGRPWDRRRPARVLTFVIKVR